MKRSDGIDVKVVEGEKKLSYPRKEMNSREKREENPPSVRGLSTIWKIKGGKDLTKISFEGERGNGRPPQAKRDARELEELSLSRGWTKKGGKPWRITKLEIVVD